jgi:hypothetical protein
MTHQIIKKNDKWLTNSEIYTNREAADVAEKSEIYLLQILSNLTKVIIERINH